MEIFLNAILGVSLFVILNGGLLVYLTVKDDYDQGYYESKVTYTTSHSIKRFDKPLTPYEFGWNSAIDDLSKEI